MPPLLRPQDAEVISPLNSFSSAFSIVMFTAVAVHPSASVTVTEYIPGSDVSNEGSFSPLLQLKDSYSWKLVTLMVPVWLSHRSGGALISGSGISPSVMTMVSDASHKGFSSLDTFTQ